MAILDYGCVVRHNNKIIDTDYPLINMEIMDMKKALGFEVESVPDYSGWDSSDGSKKIDIKDKFMGYAGTKDLFVCFYKTSFYIIEKNICTKVFNYYLSVLQFKQYKTGLCFSPQQVKTKSGITITVKALNGYDRFIAEFRDKNGDKWSILYGYGVVEPRPSKQRFEYRCNVFKIRNPEYNKIKRFVMDD